MSKSSKNEKRKPQTTKVYNSSLERSLVTLHNFDRTLLEIDRLRARPANLSIQLVVDTLKSNLEVRKRLSEVVVPLIHRTGRCVQSALFGCEVDVGLFVDANQRVIEFYGDPNYVRKLYKGESSSFRALEKRETVVEVRSSLRRLLQVEF